MSGIYYYEENPLNAVGSAVNGQQIGNTDSTSKNTDNGIGLSILSTANRGLPSLTDYVNTLIAENDSPKNYGEQLQKNLIYGDPNKGIIGRSIDSMFNVPMKNLKNYYSNLENTNFNFSNTQDVINGYNTMPKATVYNNNHLKNDSVYGTVVPNIVQNTNNKIMNNFNNAVSNMQKQNNLNNLKSLYAMGGSLDYSLQNQYAINNYMNVMNKSKITSMPNSFQRPQFDSMNYFSMGGMTDFNEVNAGGTHEQNQFGGVKVRPDALVEEGETITGTDNGDYVFSDRLKLSKEECKQLGVPEGSTYAEASKILRKEYDEMPNDEIARRGWEQSRDTLIQSQEIQKQEIALKEARKQGLNSPKMQGIDSQVMQDMYYNGNPQEEDLLQQGMNPSIKSYDKGGSMYDIFQIGAQIPSLISGMKNPDYSYANEVLNSIGKDQRLSIPNNYTYHTYNPVDELQYLNRQQAQDAALINTLQNTSDPSRNYSILAVTAQNAANRSKLINDIANINHARKVENTKLNNAITDQINNNLYKQAQFNASLDNLDYNRMVQGLKMKQEADAIRGANLSAGLTGLSNWADARRQEDNSLGIAALSAVAQGVPFTDSMINALYDVNNKLGDIGFSTRSDYSAYKNMAQRRDIINALKEGKYNKNIYGNLGNYLEDQSIKDYIISQYNANPNWTGIDLGLSADQLQSIIKSINTGG